MTDRIRDEDMPTLAKIAARVRRAQELQAQANDLMGAVRVDAAELHAAYGLDARAGDAILEDGTIRRGQPET